MARVTVEDCLENVTDRFTLIHMTAKRVRQLRKGIEPTITRKNKDVVVALREIAAGNVIIAEKVEEEDVVSDTEDILLEEQKDETVEDEHDAEI